MRARLDSWKDIAAYVGRDVRTVIRWEDNGLPIHRVPGGKRQAVFAYPAEIDDWLLGRQKNGVARVASGLAPLHEAMLIRGRWKLAIFCLAGLSMLLGIATALAVFPRSGNPGEVPKLVRISHDGLFKHSLVTDGVNLYFSELADGRIQLSRMPVSGGPIIHMATPFGDALVEDFNADRGELLVVGSSGTGAGDEHESAPWMVPVDGQAPKRVGNVLCHSATRSPDGRAMAYARRNSIFLTVDEGNSSHELRQFESEPTRLHWTQSGDRIRFVLRNAETLEFVPWEIELGDHFDVRSVSRIPLPTKDCCLGWAESDDHEFFSTGNRDGSQIWARPRRRHWWQAGHPQSVELSTQVGILVSLASDPRTGRLFAIGIEPPRGEFVRFDPFSRTFNSFLPGVSGEFPEFSGDGQWVAYIALEDRALWIIRTDGKDRKRLTSPASFSDVELPRWSPDGTRIAFMARRPDRPYRVYIVPSEGGPAREASVGSDNQGAPTWSPDGKRLAYANVECQESHSCAVHRIELSTGKVDTLPDSDGLRTARWSPNGRYIAALRPDRHELLLFDVRQQSWRRLTDSIVGDDLSWSHDSRYLFSARPSGDKPEILRIPINGGKPEAVADLVSLSKLSGKFHVGFCVAPDNSIILFRALNSSEIYALDWRSR